MKQEPTHRLPFKKHAASPAAKSSAAGAAVSLATAQSSTPTTASLKVGKQQPKTASRGPSPLAQVQVL